MNANKSRKVGNIFQVLQNILDFYRGNGFYEEYAAELEYFCVKICLCSSLSRIGRVTDKELETKLLDKTLFMRTFRFIRRTHISMEKQEVTLRL